MERITPKQARILAGFKTMREIADAMEMPYSTYVCKETGKTSFTIREAMLFADLCNKHFREIDFLCVNSPKMLDKKGENNGDQTGA